MDSGFDAHARHHDACAQAELEAHVKRLHATPAPCPTKDSHLLVTTAPLSGALCEYLLSCPPSLMRYLQRHRLTGQHLWLVAAPTRTCPGRGVLALTNQGSATTAGGDAEEQRLKHRLCARLKALGVIRGRPPADRVLQLCHVSVPRVRAAYFASLAGRASETDCWSSFGCLDLIKWTRWARGHVSKQRSS